MSLTQWLPRAGARWSHWPLRTTLAARAGRTGWAGEADRSWDPLRADWSLSTFGSAWTHCVIGGEEIDPVRVGAQEQDDEEELRDDDDAQRDERDHGGRIARAEARG